MHPPFLFCLAKRETGRARSKEKGAWTRSGAVALRADGGGRREMVPAGLRGLPDGRGGARYRLDGGFPRRGCRQKSGCKDAFELLLFSCLALRRSQDFRHQCSTGSSFRAFRFATRCPGGRRGLCFRADVGIGPYAGVGAPARADTQVGPYGWAGPRFSVGADAHIRPLHRLLLPSRPAAAKRGAEAVRRPPRRRSTIRHGTAVPEIAENPSVPEGQAKSEHAPIRRPPCARRATAPECAKRFSLWTVHGPFLFWQDKREMGGAFRWTSPLREQNPPWPP